MAHTAHSDVAISELPTFVVVGDRDSITPSVAMESRIVALRRIWALVEYHKYSGVGHGFWAGQGIRAEGWIGRAIQCWEKEFKKAP